jgi:hypothetical protein
MYGIFTAHPSDVRGRLVTPQPMKAAGTFVSSVVGRSRATWITATSCGGSRFNGTGFVRWNPIRLLFLGLLVFLSPGCAGSGRLEMISLNTRRITAAEPLVITLRPGESYWWLNEQGALCIALRGSHDSIFGPGFSRELLLSFVLGEPPAGPGREYSITTNTLRFRRRAGLTHLRGHSLTGAAVVWDYGRSTLHGRFRMTLRQQTYSVLTDWTGDARYLVVGEFKARFNPAAGARILVATEEGVMKRPAAAE